MANSGFWCGEARKNSLAEPLMAPNTAGPQTGLSVQKDFLLIAIWCSEALFMPDGSPGAVP